MQYHPDKNKDDVYKIARFNEIKEAYEVLTNPSAKENYLQERWLKKANGSWMPDEPITPFLILKQALELNKSISLMDVHRMDYNSIESRISNLLTPGILEKLQTFNEKEINYSICYTLLKATHPLPLAHTKRIAELATQLVCNDTRAVNHISKILHQKKEAAQIEKLKPLLILVTIILICLLIFLSGN